MRTNRFGLAPLLVTLAAAGAVGGTGAAHAATTIATLDRPTPVRAWNDTAIFSVRDGASDGYRLAVSERGGAPRVLPIAAQAEPFDADIGADRHGAATVVYSRCEQPPDNARDCAIRRYALATGVDIKLVGTDGDVEAETRPTISGARVAWVSTDVLEPTKPPVVKVRALTWPLERPSQRLRVLPAGRGALRVRELELSGRDLAVRLTSRRGPGVETDDHELRLHRLGGRTRVIARLSAGIAGQQLVGASFADGALAWARTCGGDPSGCPATTSGAFRYALRTGRYALAGFTRRLTGFAVAGGGRAFEVQAPERPGGYCGNALATAVPAPSCDVVLSDALPFRAVRPPR